MSPSAHSSLDSLPSVWQSCSELRRAVVTGDEWRVIPKIGGCWTVPCLLDWSSGRFSDALARSLFTYAVLVPPFSYS
jgi:hypothetical protein